jgi:hypothetical protein
MTMASQTPGISRFRDAASIEGLMRTFSNSLSVVDLARPLISLDEGQSAQAGIDVMCSTGQPALGVRRAGRIAGWVDPQALSAGGLLADALLPFEEAETLGDSAGIQEVLSAMAGRKQVFVRWLGEVAGVVHRADLQKPAVRMWLFGVITLLDSNLTWAIEQLYPDDCWASLISEGRRQKARALWDERRRRGSDCRLVECLQIKDKADVLIKDADHLKLLGLTSRREADRLGGDIELLRNHLAHGQELEACHLATASRLAESLEGILRADLASRLVERQRTHPKPETSQPPNPP